MIVGFCYDGSIMFLHFKRFQLKPTINILMMRLYKE